MAPVGLLGNGTTISFVFGVNPNKPMVALTYDDGPYPPATNRILNTLEKYGAVSEETAMELAAGIRALSGADVGISTTGIAGPGGGTETKPVGLVYMGIASEQGVRALKFNFTGDRARVRILASGNALSLALNEIKEEE